jgi:hypothetical protein
MKNKFEKCFRCDRKGNQTWNICSDGNKKRMICIECDIKLNELVLKFMGFRNWKSKMKKYIEKITND